MQSCICKYVYCIYMIILQEHTSLPAAKLSL
uniref:Uncharacterized protein n=1 Tax=Arundo donax TaxID=35708 RepID=A0A0A8ZLX9_ARUDO